MARELAILGAGNMAEAIARGLLRSKTFEPRQMVSADVSADRRAVFADRLGIECLSDAAVAASQASTLLLCVKPQHMDQLLRTIADSMQQSALAISIAAGISTLTMDRVLGSKEARLIRAMPNTPMLVNAGMVVLSAGPRSQLEDLATARRLFEPGALVLEMPEEKLDAVTALSGSGPAYFFYLVEQMIAAGIEMGLSAEDSRTLATRTAVGAGRMLESTTESPQELRRRVTSPGGTTEAALSHMEKNRLDQIVIDAVKAAQRRGSELGRSKA